MPTAKSRTRPRRRKYKPVLDLPPLSQEEYLALRDNIALNGVLVPILVDSDGRIIDGNCRKQIANELGYDCPEKIHPGEDEEEIRALARALNLARRQLNQQQKREIVADQLGESPGKSNRWIAKQLGVHHATVASVRKQLESTGQIIQLEATEGLDGKRRSIAKNYWQVRKDGTGDSLLHHPTPPHVTEVLLSRETFDGLILEPASGNGSMTEVLRQHGYKIRATDIKTGHDFLARRAPVPNVVTNPPYSQGVAEQFVRKAMEITEKKIAMLLPFYFLEGVQRHELFTGDWPVKAVYIFSRRPTFGEHEDHSPFGCAWVVWDRSWKRKAVVEWVM